MKFELSATGNDAKCHDVSVKNVGFCRFTRYVTMAGFDL
jgi:hypothetical protein